MQIEISPNFSIEYSREGSGAPIVFLHAFPLTNEMWQSQMEALPKYSVLAPNTRGFGASSPFESTPSTSQMARDLNDFLNALKIEEPIVLCGLSMGGYTALSFAREYSSRLRALVLCDARAEADDDETRAKREINIQLVREKGSHALAERMVPVLLGEAARKENPELVARVVEWGSAQEPSTLVAALEALRDRPDATAWLTKIKVPTLLVFGEEDALAPPFVIETLKNGIANSKLEIIPRAGHLSNLEQGEKFNAVLLEFLKSLD